MHSYSIFSIAIEIFYYCVDVTVWGTEIVNTMYFIVP